MNLKYFLCDIYVLTKGEWKKMRRFWIHEIYIYMCSSYLKDNPNKIDQLMRILFLIQINSLKTKGKPFYRYKTYFDGKKVSIAYLTDLLEISPIIVFSNDHIYGNRKMKSYLKFFKKYIKMSEQDIINKINQYIDNNKAGKYYKISRDVYKRQMYGIWPKLSITTIERNNKYATFKCLNKTCFIKL